MGSRNIAGALLLVKPVSLVDDIGARTCTWKMQVASTARMG
jgi:hypothetical protein